jgi:hypothetical protein
MRTVLALLLSLSAGSALALEIDAPPATTGAIAHAAKVMALMPQGEASFQGALILSDAEIAELVVPYPIHMAASASPAAMDAARAAVN